MNRWAAGTRNGIENPPTCPTPGVGARPVDGAAARILEGTWYPHFRQAARRPIDLALHQRDPRWVIGSGDNKKGSALAYNGVVE